MPRRATTVSTADVQRKIKATKKLQMTARQLDAAKKESAEKRMDYNQVFKKASLELKSEQAKPPGEESILVQKNYWKITLQCSEK